MKSNLIIYERVVSVIGFIFLVIAALLAYFLFDGDRLSVIEKIADSRIVITLVHSICALIIFSTIFKQNNISLISVLVIESVLTILTDYEHLGIFLFDAALILIISKNMFLTKRKIIFYSLGILHVLSLAGTYTHGIRYTIIAFGTSIFTLAFYIWIYIILKSKFASYIPKSVIENQIFVTKKPGQKLSLSDYNLTDRHKTFILENINNNLSYKELSEKYNVSISTVKKDFSEVYKIFNVSKLEELRILLLRYQVEK